MAQQPIFSKSELFCLEDSMNNFKLTHSKYCDKEGIEEIDNILLKLKHFRTTDHEEFKALYNLTHEDKI